MGGWSGGGPFEPPSPHSFPSPPASLPHVFPAPSPYPPRFAQARLADDGGAWPDAGPRLGPTGQPGSDGGCGGTWENTMLAQEAARVRCTHGRLTHITFAIPHAPAQTETRTQTNTETHRHTSTQTHRHTHTKARTHKHTSTTNTNAQTQKHKHKSARTHNHTQTHRDTHRHTSTPAHGHGHTHTQPGKRRGQRGVGRAAWHASS